MEGGGVIVTIKFKFDSLGQEPSSLALCWTNCITSLMLLIKWEQSVFCREMQQQRDSG